MGDEKMNLSIDAEVKRMAQEKAKALKRTVTQYITDLIMIDSGHEFYARLRESPLGADIVGAGNQKPPMNIIKPADGSGSKESSKISTLYPKPKRRRSSG